MVDSLALSPRNDRLNRTVRHDDSTLHLTSGAILTPSMRNTPTFWPVTNAIFLAHVQLLDLNMRGGGRLAVLGSNHSISKLATDKLNCQSDRADITHAQNYSDYCFGIKVRDSFHAYLKYDGSLHYRENGMTVKQRRDPATRAMELLAGDRLKDINDLDLARPLEVILSIDLKRTIAVVILADLTCIFEAFSSDALQSTCDDLSKSHDIGRLPTVDTPGSWKAFTTGWRDGATRCKNGDASSYTENPTFCWQTAGFAFGRAFGPGSIQEITTAFDSVLARVLACGDGPSEGVRTGDSDNLGYTAVEGGSSYEYQARYERNPQLRRACIEVHGAKCAVCGWIQARSYSNLVNGADLIEVHHIEPLSVCQEEHEVNSKTDLVPLCPTCHRAIHSRRRAYTVQELREIFVPA